MSLNSDHQLQVNHIKSSSQITVYLHLFKTVHNKYYISITNNCTLDKCIQRNVKFTFEKKYSSSILFIYFYYKVLTHNESSFEDSIKIFHNSVYPLYQQLLQVKQLENYKVESGLIMCDLESIMPFYLKPLTVFSNDCCSICYEEITSNEHPIYSCGHTIHTDCLSKCNKAECPICRTQAIIPQDIYFDSSLRKYFSILFYKCKPKSIKPLVQYLLKCNIEEQTNCIKTLLNKKTDQEITKIKIIKLLNQTSNQLQQPSIQTIQSSHQYIPKEEQYDSSYPLKNKQSNKVE